MAENCFQQVSALDLAPKGSWPGFGLKRPSWSWSGRKYRGMLTTSNRLYFEILQRRDKKNHEHCFGGWLSSPPSQVCIYIYIHEPPLTTINHHWGRWPPPPSFHSHAGIHPTWWCQVRCAYCSFYSSSTAVSGGSWQKKGLPHWWLMVVNGG